MSSGDLCRLCGERKKMLNNMFNGNFLQTVRDTVQLTITMDDSLPKNACYECQRQIESFHAFKMRCQRAERKFYEIAVNAQHTRTVHCIKQEQADAEHHVTTLHPSTEHNYFAVAPACQRIKIKTESVTDVVITGDPIEEDAEEENSNVVFEQLVYQHALADVKKPIIEVVRVLDLDTVEDEALSKNENLNLNQISGEANYEQKPIFYENSPNYGGFTDENLMLGENEQELSDSDYERIEAEIMKRNDPSIHFKCPLCDRSFKFYKGYLKHKNNAHREDDTVYSCSHCSEEGKSTEYSSIALLKRHIYRIHKGEPQYTCMHCQMKFRLKREYQSHLVCHRKIICQCDVCKKGFTSKKKLRSHLQRHINPKYHDCAECDKSFKSISGLQYHNERHKGFKIFHCVQCGNEFTSKNGLVRHLKAHDDQFRPCSSCDKSFTQTSSLRRHQMSVHETSSGPTRPAVILSCTVCDKSFWNHSNLANHKKIHEKKHLCTYCGIKCARIQQLKEHVLTVHKKMKHQCPVGGCGKTYSQRTPLATHFRRRHPGLKLMSRNRHTTVPQLETLSNSHITYEFSFQQSSSV